MAEGATRRETRDEEGPRGTRREIEATRREDAGFDLNRSEGGHVEQALTRRESVAGSEERVAVIEEWPAHGAEADVMLAQDWDSGRRVVLKRYRKGIFPDERVLARISEASKDPLGRPHLVELIRYGTDGDRWFEVQEFCEHGSLHDLLVKGERPEVSELIREIATALSFAHSRDLLHLDLKPANLFVRARIPFDLVLGDFGVARVLDASVRWTQIGKGTPAYAPPEFEGGEQSKAWDWWSLGMIVAELAVGRHPFELPDGTMLSDQQIRSSLAQRPVDLSDVSDPRTRLLCQGLLTRDRHHRWGGPQVTEWLEGGSPSVVRDKVNTTTERRRTVLFAGIEHDSPAELARSFQQHWAEAQRRLFQERDQTLVEEVERFLRQHQLDEANRLLASPSSASEIPRHFADLLAEMDPDLEPVYDGLRLTPAGLESAAVEVIRAGGDHPSSKVLDEVRRQNVLTVWRALPGMADASDLQQRWIDADGELERVLGSLAPHGYTPTPHDWALARAWLLACTVNPEHQCRQLSELVTGLDPTTADRQSWWHALRSAENSGPCQLVATLLTHPSAVSQTHQQDELESQRRQQSEREKERLLQVKHDQEEIARAAEAARRRPMVQANQQRRARARSKIEQKIGRSSIWLHSRARSELQRELDFLSSMDHKLTVINVNYHSPPNQSAMNQLSNLCRWESVADVELNTGFTKTYSLSLSPNQD